MSHQRRGFCVFRDPLTVFGPPGMVLMVLLRPSQHFGYQSLLEEFPLQSLRKIIEIAAKPISQILTGNGIPACKVRAPRHVMVYIYIQSIFKKYRFSVVLEAVHVQQPEPIVENVFCFLLVQNCTQTVSSLIMEPYSTVWGIC